MKGSRLIILEVDHSLHRSIPYMRIQSGQLNTDISDCNEIRTKRFLPGENHSLTRICLNLVINIESCFTKNAFLEKGNKIIRDFIN